MNLEWFGQRGGQQDGAAEYTGHRDAEEGDPERGPEFVGGRFQRVCGDPLICLHRSHDGNERNRQADAEG